MAIQSSSNLLSLTLVTFLISLSLLNMSTASITDEKLPIAPLGGFRALNPSDPNVVALGKYAVREHNRLQHTWVSFQSVVRAAYLQVGGDRYKFVLVIKGSEYDTQEQYSATVLEKNGLWRLVGLKKTPFSN